MAGRGASHIGYLLRKTVYIYDKPPFIFFVSRKNTPLCSVLLPLTHFLSERGLTNENDKQPRLFGQQQLRHALVGYLWRPNDRFAQVWLIIIMLTTLHLGCLPSSLSPSYILCSPSPFLYETPPPSPPYPSHCCTRRLHEYSDK